MRRNEQICARVSLDEMTTLKDLAARQSMRLSEFIRQALAEKMNRLTTAYESNRDLAVHRQPDVPFRYSYR